LWILEGEIGAVVGEVEVAVVVGWSECDGRGGVGTVVVVGVQMVEVAERSFVVGVAAVVGAAGRESGVAGRHMPVVGLDNQAAVVALAVVGIAVWWLAGRENRPVAMAVVAAGSIAAAPRVQGSLAEAAIAVEDHVVDMEI
jgi:hypothetical protein